MIFGAAWAFLMWAERVREREYGKRLKPRRPRPYTVDARLVTALARLVEALAKLLTAVAELVKLDYGAPALIFLGGLILVIIGQV